MSRILVFGLPRSGTTWLSKMLAAAPGVRYVHEPDNRGVDPFAWLATAELGTRPSLAPGDSATEYRRMWELAFAGGWPDDGFAYLWRRLGSSSRVPKALRIPAIRTAARTALRRPVRGDHQLVKSVAVSLAVEWVAAEFDPTVVVVWRHPLNLVPAWVQQGWMWAAKAASAPAIRARFEGTPVWPPPAGEGSQAVAWAVCAESVPLLETAAAYPEWLLVSHERQCLDPLAAFRDLYAALGLMWTTDVEQQVMMSNRPGSGFQTARRSADEAKRWQSRLTPSEQKEILEIVRRFEDLSPLAAEQWNNSPALT